MKKLAVLSVLLVLAACDRRGSVPAQFSAPAPARSAEVARLVADPAALDDAHRRCKLKAAVATPEFCAAAAEATRQRFLARGSPYAPSPVRPFAEAPR
jgi:hypothetical protein